MNGPAQPGLPADAESRHIDAIDLVGLQVDDARAQVEAADGTLLVVPPSGNITFDLVPSRVTVVALDGVVVESWGRG